MTDFFDGDGPDNGSEPGSVLRFPGEPTATTSGEADPDKEVVYKPQRERAMIRERVRRFTQELEHLRDQDLEHSGRKHVSINTMIRYDSLTGYRFAAFRLVVLLPIVVILAAFASFAFAGLFDLVGVPTFAEAPSPYWVAAALSYVVSAGWAITTLGKRFDHYNLATRDQMHEIEQRITQRMSELQIAFAAAQGNFKVEVSPEQDKTLYQQSIIGMFTAWRELERLPIYVRHDFTEYFSSVNDDRKYGLEMNLRRWVVALFCLGFALSAVTLGLSLLASDSTATSMAFGTLAHCTFGLQISLLAISVFLQRRTGWTPGRVVAAVVAAGALVMLLMSATGWISGAFSEAPQLSVFVAANLFATGLAGVLAALISGAVYKNAADKLVVALIRALKTHSKSYAITLTRRGFKDWTADTQGGSADWNGWTPDYQDRMREKYRADGHSEEEIDIRIGTDPVIYVGNEKNRRLQAAEIDLVTSFYAKLPVVRQ